MCTNFASGKTDAYLIHVGEGTDATALGEFGRSARSRTTPGCLLAPQTATITHGIAFTATEFATMAQAGMKLTWSPRFERVALRRDRRHPGRARRRASLVALAPDWSMGGSQNLLDELRFADAWDNAHWGDKLRPGPRADGDRNAAAVLALATRSARRVGYVADLAVFAGDGTKPYDAILAARPKTCSS